MGTDVPKMSEALRPVNRGPEGERRDRADARHAHKTGRLPYDLMTGDGEDLLGQAGELLQHRGQVRQERLDDPPVRPGHR